MYHYVRNVQHSRYSDIKGLETKKFEGQVQYIKKHYNIISGPDLMDAIRDDSPLPPRPVLLTFDDGYKDHFTDALPILEKEYASGCFFPTARCILEHEVLDVNKIQFVLACTPNKSLLVEYIFRAIEANQSKYKLHLPSEYWDTLAKPSRWDSKDVMFCKHTLQRELPEQLRKEIINDLFTLYVTSDETAFSEELYMSLDQLQDLQARGMCIGSHGYGHSWMNTLSPQQQEADIDQSLLFLKSAGVDLTRWMMCYPYGAHNHSLRKTCSDFGCAMAFTTETKIADLNPNNLLTLPRLDTNHIPKGVNQAPNEWTKKILY